VGCSIRACGGQTVLGVHGRRAAGGVAGLAAVTLVAADRSVVLDDPVTLGNRCLAVSQAAPFDGLVMIDDLEAVIPVTVS
jgi:hypothetical protein